MEEIRKKCIKKIERKINCKLVKREPKSTTVCEDKEKKITVVCLYSKKHKKRKINYAGFWLSFHSQQKQSLLKYNKGYLGLGCGTEKTVFLIPRKYFFKILDVLPSIKDEGLDFFIRVEKIDGEFYIDTRRQDDRYISIQKYLI